MPPQPTSTGPLPGPARRITTLPPDDAPVATARQAGVDVPAGAGGQAAVDVPAGAGGRAAVDVPAGAGGQAAVEIVALLPLLALLLALAYQALLAGQAAWEAHVAARAAARANAVGGDAARAARAHLPSGLEPGLRVRATPSGDVRVSLRIPRVVPALSLGRVAATAHFRPQDA